MPLLARGSTVRSIRWPPRTTAVATSAPGRCLAHEPYELTNASDSLAIELHDDVTFLDPGFRCRAVRRHVLDLHAACGGVSTGIVVALDITDGHPDFAAAAGQHIECTLSARRDSLRVHCRR